MNTGYSFSFRLIFFTLIVFFTLVEPSYSEYWPREQWRTSPPERQGMSSEVLSNMLESLQGKDHRLDSIIVIRNGYVVLESYMYTAEPNFKHQVYSCTKSVSSALIGIAIDKGYIKSVDQGILEFFPKKIPTVQDNDKLNITLKHLLTMAAGFQCEDTKAHEFKGLKEMWQTDDWVQYMIDLPLIETPGSRFQYCNGASSLLTAIIQKTSGETAFEFASKHLFSPLGITDTHWKSRNGLTIGYSDLTMRPLDMAKIGYLFLKDGKWQDQQIISPEWIKESARKQIDNYETYGYGYQWWILSPERFAALGAHGQRIFVLRDQNMVVVFTGRLEQVRSQVPEHLLYNYILPSVKPDAPLPVNQKMVERLHRLTISLRTKENLK